MGHGHKLSCVLCHERDETPTTGPLSTKNEVTAHQNCLLFSAGIFCRDSPQSDDLFGFSVEDVINEVKRGNKLMCSGCKRKGATAGCGVKRCKRSYHYPCAVDEGAESFEDPDTGKYELFCFKHCKKENNGFLNGDLLPSAMPGTSKSASEAASSKRNINGDSAVAGPSAYYSDSNSSSSWKHLSSKRRLPFSDREEDAPSKRKSEARKRTITDSSDSDMEMFAPIDHDLEESAHSVPEARLFRKDTESSTGSTPGYQVENERRNENQEDDESDAESQSLLPPVGSSIESQSLSVARAAQTTQTEYPVEVVKTEGGGFTPVQSPVSQRSSTRPSPSPDHSKPCNVTDSPPCTSPPVYVAPPVEPICVTILTSPDSPVALNSDPEPSISSASFWKSCNTAGCTKNIFDDFMNEITDISRRIQADQASQEDYDLALKMMKASGKLAELVTKQQKELQRKQMELQKAMNAMNKVVSAVSK